MYVICVEVDLVEVPMESGVQLGLGEGPINKVGPMSQPRGTINTASRTLICTYPICIFQINFNLGSYG